MNPLLEVQFQIPFDQIKAEHVEPAIDALLAASEKSLEATTASADPLMALDEMTEPLDYAMNVVRHLESVADNSGVARGIQRGAAEDQRVLFEPFL